MFPYAPSSCTYSKVISESTSIIHICTSRFLSPPPILVSPSCAPLQTLASPPTLWPRQACVVASSASSVLIASFAAVFVFVHNLILYLEYIQMVVHDTLNHIWYCGVGPSVCLYQELALEMWKQALSCEPHQCHVILRPTCL